MFLPQMDHGADSGIGVGRQQQVGAAGDVATGYGNAMNVHFTVRAFEQAGVHGVSIEDQVSPKRCGHMKGGSDPGPRGRRQVRAAVDARRSGDFLIRARTDVAALNGIDDAIERLNMYAAARADCLFADALLSKDDVAKVAANVPKPLFVNMDFGIRTRPTTPLIGPKDLQDLGVGAVSYPRLLISAALSGMLKAMAVLKSEVVENNGTPDRPDLMVAFDDLNALTRMDFLDALEARFSGPDDA